MLPYNRAALYTTKASCILVFLVTLLGRYLMAQKETSVSVGYLLLSVGICILPAAIAYMAIKFFPRHIDQWIAKSSQAIEEWVRTSPAKSTCLAIALVAGLSLFLELVLIRWQASLFPVFALHKNFTLLACFCGLGLGYAMAAEVPLLLPMSLPLLALTLLLLVLLRFGTDPNILFMLQAVPVEENISLLVFHSSQMNFMSNPLFYLPVCILLTMTFALNALVFLPIGQFCGYLMQRGGTPLVSYGYNLLGSALGVVLIFILSSLWVGPVIWFGISVTLLIWYQLVSSEARRVAALSAALCVITVAWPVRPMVETIYSPYQIIEKVTSSSGLMRFLAAGSYVQMIEDFNAIQNPWYKKATGYLELPYKTASVADKVLIAGSGSGNDVQAALASGAKSVDAVEIDPTIVALGRTNHPQHPYQDPRVHTVIDDARNFFKTTRDMYDVVVFGGQDTTILLSHGSNVRLDTFVFTEQGLNEAFGHLKPGGIMSLSFGLGTDPYLGKKIYYMMKNIPGASTPASITNGNTTMFLIRKNEPLELPMRYIEQNELAVVTRKFEDPSDVTRAIPTDDWPFFYMNARAWPANYMVSLVLALALSLLLVRKLLPKQRWNRSLVPFFFLGAGFMLVETKTITELGLVFGNTWQVIGITIIGVLTMAFFANLTASRYPQISPVLVFICLLSVITLGYALAIHGGVAYLGMAAKLGAVVLLTSPLFFSGIVFSTLLNNTRDITGAMAYNLMGAMLGGLFEYNSLRFGFASLYLMAFALYALAWFSARREAGAA